MKDHADITDESQKQMLLAYFDPYAEAFNSKRECLTAFVGFDFSAYESVVKLPIEQRETAFEAAFLKRIESACDLFAAKLSASSFKDIPVHFFLIPFPDIAEFRSMFFQKLGVTSD